MIDESKLQMIESSACSRSVSHPHMAGDTDAICQLVHDYKQLKEAAAKVMFSIDERIEHCCGSDEAQAPSFCESYGCSTLRTLEKPLVEAMK